MTSRLHPAKNLLLATAAAFAATALAPLWTAAAPAAANAQNADAQRVISLLSGSWKSTGSIEDVDGETAVVMHIAPISLRDLPNAMYVEQARDGALHDPFRQAIFQVYEYDGSLRLRTLEFKNTPGIRPVLVGYWAIPEVFPDLSVDGMYATLELALTPEGDGFSGKTPAPFPCAIAGAVQMTSAMSIQPGRITSTDIGYAADGSVAWGDQEGTTFERYTPDVATNFLGEGLITIDYEPGSGPGAVEGYDITVFYTGWTPDLSAEPFTATEFDSSFKGPGDPRPWTFPLPGNLIPGWNTAMEGVRIGMLRRIIVPSHLAYGQQGRQGIPPNSDLTFEVRILDMLDPDAPLDQQPRDMADEENAETDADE